MSESTLVQDTTGSFETFFLLVLSSSCFDIHWNDRFDDATLLRFLRARKFDITRAKEMWAANEEWRKSFGTDAIARSFEFPEARDVDKYYPQFYHKTDKVSSQTLHSVPYVFYLTLIDVRPSRTADQSTLNSSVN
jgi:hypothetical protein